MFLIPEFICELSQPQILFQTCSVPFWSLGGTFSLLRMRHQRLFRLRGPNVNSPEGVESGSPPRRRSVRLRVGEGSVPTTAGDRDDKAKQTYIGCIAAKPNRVWRGH